MSDEAAVLLLEVLESLGMALEIEGGVLYVANYDQRLTDELLDLVRRHAKPLRALVEARASAVEEAARIIEGARR